MPAGFMGGSPGRSSPGSGCSGRRHFHTRHAIRTYIRIQGMPVPKAPVPVGRRARPGGTGWMEAHAPRSLAAVGPAVTSGPGAACETIWS
ncbi:hypothetical protein J2T22_003922 [Pseudarthrobacter defluvii]|uniref:Uncharacterized protein n=1 Tax=Pseudarthrobacter defluvii TaxID=410837 RepID=A0ABT9UPY3_9MICC|nr:hypothetical protein [Pseudarthrobacter defluvii]